MGQCVFGSNTAFLHTWTQHWNSARRALRCSWGENIAKYRQGAVAKMYIGWKQKAESTDISGVSVSGHVLRKLLK